VRAPRLLLNAVQFPGTPDPVGKTEELKIRLKSGTVAVGMTNVVQTVMKTVLLPQEADIRGKRGPRNCLHGGPVSLILATAPVAGAVMVIVELKFGAAGPIDIEIERMTMVSQS